MIDVTFLLLIFFSVTTTFKRAEGYLGAKLPTDVGQPTVALPISPIVIRVQQYGAGPNEYRLRIDQFVESPATFGDLTRMLKDIQGNPGFDENTPVVIAAEPDASWDHVVNCWNAALRAGCKNIAFGAD
jgi:biopolymer transport protein ExbD